MMGMTTSDAQLGDALLNSDPNHLVELANLVMEGKADIATIAGISDDELEAVYTVAHGFYTNSQYRDALDVFRFLCMHRHMDARFWFGLGAAAQMEKQHSIAVQAYRTCLMLNLEDAQPPLRAAECYSALGEREEMRLSLEAALEVAAQFPANNAAHAARAQLILDKLNA